MLLMVLLLVLMFTGLGLLAMRHSQGELRSAASYADSFQATEAAEAAILMAATDMHENWNLVNQDCGSYKYFLCDTPAYVGQPDIQVPFSTRYDRDGDCTAVVPEPGRNGTAPLAATGTLSTNYAQVNITYTAAERAPSPPGYSNDQDNSNSQNNTVGFFYVSATSTGTYGADPTSAFAHLVPSGQAQVTSHMKIGPVPCF